MTKAELIHALQPFTDECELRIFVKEERGRRREAHIDRVAWLWPKGDAHAHVSLVPLTWDILTMDEKEI